VEAGLGFEEFYTAQFQRVFRAIFLSSGDRELAQDVTQEAFKLAFARWRRLSRHEWAGGWVMTTALNLMRKERKRSPEVELDPARHGAPVHLNGTDLALVHALRALPHRQRTAILLHYLADLPVHAVAESMNVADGTVKALLSQARTNLEKSPELHDD
jgi:RNA polymerase sigma-70 factor (ECF subfamily)